MTWLGRAEAPSRYCPLLPASALSRTAGSTYQTTSLGRRRKALDHRACPRGPVCPPPSAQHHRLGGDTSMPTAVPHKATLT
jgi:hypothetical protein